MAKTAPRYKRYLAHQAFILIFFLGSDHQISTVTDVQPGTEFDLSDEVAEVVKRARPGSISLMHQKTKRDWEAD